MTELEKMLDIQKTLGIVRSSFFIKLDNFPEDFSCFYDSHELIKNENDEIVNVIIKFTIQTNMINDHDFINIIETCDFIFAEKIKLKAISYKVFKEGFEHDPFRIPVILIESIYEPGGKLE